MLLTSLWDKIKMAYDPNDPADKAIFDAAVAAALVTVNDEHEAEVGRLTAKNTQLLDKLSKARKGEGGAGTEEVTRLEHELEETQGKLREAESAKRQADRDLKTISTERDTLKTNLDTESNFSRKLLVENGLTAELVAANVAPEFMPAARALLEKQVTVKAEGDNRNAVVGDKSLCDFVKEWSSSDQGKVFVKAPSNGGGGTQAPGAPNGGAKKIYEMNDAERLAAHNLNPADFAARVAAGENKPPPTA